MAGAQDIKFGATYGRVDGAISPLDFAERCEVLGFDSVWTVDVIGWPAPDPLVFLAGAAARTQRISLGMAVGVLPFRHPILWAKAVTSLQQMSGGRLILGAGIGEFAHELEMLGVRVKDRARMADEALPLVKRLAQGGKISYQGGFYQFQDVTVGALPGNRPPIPIWYGAEWHNGIVPAAVRRAVRFCDGFIPLGVPRDSYSGIRKDMEECARKENRDLSSFTWSLYIWCLMADSWEDARRDAERLLQIKMGSDFRLESTKSYLLGTPKDFIEGIERFASQGVEHFVISPVCIGKDVMPQYERVAREVLPHFKKAMGG